MKRHRRIDCKEGLKLLEKEEIDNPPVRLPVVFDFIETGLICEISWHCRKCDAYTTSFGHTHDKEKRLNEIKHNEYQCTNCMFFSHRRF